MIMSAVWCSWCAKYTRGALSDSNVITYLNNYFISVFVDIDRRVDDGELVGLADVPVAELADGRGGDADDFVAAFGSDLFCADERTAGEHTLPVVMEKPVPRLWGDIVDPLIALARALAATTTLKLGTGICLVPERNPLLLAKEVATLDMYSRGRFLFGIGAGWLQEETEITQWVDPLGGSWLIEELTDGLERQARQEIEAIDRLGGMETAIELYYPQRSIHASAVKDQRDLRDGKSASPDD